IWHFFEDVLYAARAGACDLSQERSPGARAGRMRCALQEKRYEPPGLDHLRSQRLRQGDQFCRFLEGKDPAWKVVDRHHSHAGHVRNVGLRSETINGEIERTTATVVLIGAHTKDNGSVINEISNSLRKKRPNGILGIKLHR